MNIQRQTIVMNGRRLTFSITPEQLSNAMIKVRGYSSEESRN